VNGMIASLVICNIKKKKKKKTSPGPRASKRKKKKKKLYQLGEPIWK
jgi:hypothetical protein